MKPELQNKAQQFVELSRSLFSKGLYLTAEILKELGATKDNPIIFDWENGDAPCVVSGDFDDDLTDCYITKLYLDGECGIFADLHAYYICNDREDVFLNDENNTDWSDIIDCLLTM